ncbi:hypothetical protein AXF42_Ash001093 [Apostasia shenzhenica]|uniref:Transcriptional elongation regulator MINIYO n=1 Tax=Apostasia shenzhenica TaxID=1088818 RepID=A0A2I0ATY8_9ASPA|nr:hypothetical protein AXF42_Ash001093 [Apostasia shenzhenica]
MRKEKTELDFSGWRDFIADCDSALPQSKTKKKTSLTTTFSSGLDEAHEESLCRVTESAVVVEMLKPSGDVVCNEGDAGKDFMEKSSGANLDRGSVENTSSSARESKSLVSNVQGFGSFMDDIHEENLARVRQMSVEEIAEARTEIMGKMNPTIIEMLKKKGRNRLGDRESTVPEQKNGNSLGKEDVETELPANHRGVSELAAMSAGWMSTGQGNSSSWKVWSERVEKVRHMRFSLEGNVLVVDLNQFSYGSKPEGGRFGVEDVAERDFLRTEGDPAALGYTINEAVALIRSMVSAQRAVALQLLANILSKALFNLLNNNVGHEGKEPATCRTDWQAVWCYTLGPEPQLVLSLRIALDDNHDSVVLACAKAIQCILSCDMNENFFNVAEKLPTIEKVPCTAPVFRTRPEVDSGFLQGGFWKYSTKPSNILLVNVDNEEDKGQEKNTIQDDVVVAGQDIAAGFIRMGILPRICYLLETEPVPALVECLVSVLIALGRHSTSCANAIIACPRLTQNVVNILTRQGRMELPCQIKAITLLKVLCQTDKRICSNFVERGVFQQVMWHWYRSPYSIEQWVQFGKENCRLTGALMVEQLRLWKVCIRYGYCIGYFADFFPNLCLWLTKPTFSKLLDYNLLDEFAYMASEAYLILGALAKWLPFLHSTDQLSRPGANFSDNNMEAWSWGYVVPMVDLAMDWLQLKEIPYTASVARIEESMNIQNTLATSMIWVISAVLSMLCCIFSRISPESPDDGPASTSLPWLPDFVPKIGLEIVKNGFLGFNNICGISCKEFPAAGCSLVEGLCYLRRQNGIDVSLSSINCLHGLLQLASLIDKCIMRARDACHAHPFRGNGFEVEGKILEEGVIKLARDDLVRVLDLFVNFVSSEWPIVQSLEAFGRGGPAPGVGVGWGSSGGGFWSLNILLAQTEAQLFFELFRIFPVVVEKDIAFLEAMKPAVGKDADSMNLAMRRLNSLFAVCLIAGPGDAVIFEAALGILLQPPVLRYLNLCMQHFLHDNKRFKPLKWEYEEKDYLLVSKVLNSHFREKWLSIKRKSSGNINKGIENPTLPNKNGALETIHETPEDQEITDVSPSSTACNSFLIEWAYQRLPIPMHWFLSAICRIGESRTVGTSSSAEILDLAKGGLFFLLCLEALSSLLFPDYQESPILSMPLAWKLHALSMSLHVNMEVLEEEKTRDVFECLQELYGKQVDDLKGKEKCWKLQDAPLNSMTNHKAMTNELLLFQSEISQSYPTFVEDLIEQFGAISYGNIIFGRQIAIYLHRSVDTPVRLAAWNALSNAYLLELLPPLESCFTGAEGFLEPPEDDEGILEAYVKSWTSGALDRAVVRGSLSFSIALHHIHAFIFESKHLDRLNLRNKLAKSLLRSYSHKKNENMLLSLLQYKLPMNQDLIHESETQRRFELLKEACEGNSSLLQVVESLNSPL